RPSRRDWIDSPERTGAPVLVVPSCRLGWPDHSPHPASEERDRGTAPTVQGSCPPARRYRPSSSLHAAEAPCTRHNFATRHIAPTDPTGSGVRQPPDRAPLAKAPAPD